MSDFTRQPLLEKLNKRNYISRVRRLERLQTPSPSALVGVVNEISGAVAGGVGIDPDGITFASSAYPLQDNVQWLADDSGERLARILGYYLSDLTYSGVEIDAIARSGATVADLVLAAFDDTDDIDVDPARSAIHLRSDNTMKFYSQGTVYLTIDAANGVTIPLKGLDVTNGHIRSNSTQINDDGVTSFVPTKAAGLIWFAAGGEATAWGLIHYATATPATTAINVGSNTNVTTGALTGTTGVDTKFTVSAHATDGKLYFENRRGGTRTIFVLLI